MGLTVRFSGREEVASLVARRKRGKPRRVVLPLLRSGVSEIVDEGVCACVRGRTLGEGERSRHLLCLSG